MSEDPTRQLPDALSFEERVLAELAAIRHDIAALDARVGSLDARLTSLEEKVDARLRETRPIWEAVQERLTGVETTLEEMERHLRQIVHDLFQTRSRVTKLEDRQPAA